MTATSDYLALDLGAESGRGLLGRFDGHRLTLEEVHRFPNVPARLMRTLHWDLPRLFNDIKDTIRKARLNQARLDAVGVDTWGVDFGLIGKGDTLLGNPVHYRDERTQGIPEKVFETLPREELYDLTGLQILPFNTVFQLIAMKRAESPLLECAETLLMMPDLVNWLLTGRRVCEYTDSSTSQLLDPRTRNWSDEVCRRLDLPRSILPDLIPPGTELGTLLPSVAEETGAHGLAVIAPATHDTASAVAAVPARGDSDWCYLSSGTWSLMGIETPAPIINETTSQLNFTNEGGIDGTTRVLKNIMGLWIVQECRRAWERSTGREWTYDDLIPRAYSAAPFVSLIDPDDPRFLPPGDMPGRIAALCRETGQPEPADEGAVLRCAMESLALKYRVVVEMLERISGRPIRTIHIVGGGTQNTLLCQFTADATGRVVLAGPIEATAIGNLLVQAMGRGKLSGLKELREVVARSFPLAEYEPRDRAAWDDAAGRFAELTARRG
jgi:rhamnulokinase